MFCKNIRDKRFWYLLLAAGIVSLAFGVIGITREPEMSGNGAMLLGMFAGFGAALTMVSIIRLLYMRFASPQKLKQAETNMKDERNIQVLRAAYTVTNAAVTIILAVMAFVFVGFDYRTPGFIAVGAMWLQVIVFFIAYQVYNKKM